MALPTAPSASTEAAAEERRSSYDSQANSTLKALMRIRANTPVYHCLVRTIKSKIYGLLDRRMRDTTFQVRKRIAKHQ